MRVLEKKVEQDTVDWWEGSCCGVQVKLNLHGRRGWPDRLFLDYGGRAVFIEFKRIDEDARELQTYIHKLLRKRGFEIYVCHTFESARECLLARPRVSEERDKTSNITGVRGNVSGSGARENSDSSGGIQHSEEAGHQSANVGGITTTPDGSNVAGRNTKVD
jgi:hypothetical protein